jgi:ATP synthase protein I
MTVKALEKSAASSISLIARILLAQLGLSAVLAAFFWNIDGSTSAFSALLGGLISVIPNAFLALRLTVPRRDPGAAALLRAAYVGELGKLALTVLLFGAVFAAVRPLSAGALFAGFIAAQLAVFAGFIRREGRPDRESSDGNG